MAKKLKRSSNSDAARQMREAKASSDKPKKHRAPRAGKAHTEPKKPASAKTGKGDDMIELMRRPDGATMEELMNASGWQAHSVRGFIATARVKRGFTIDSTKDPMSGARRYTVKA